MTDIRNIIFAESNSRENSKEKPILAYQLNLLCDFYKKRYSFHDLDTLSDLADPISQKISSDESLQNYLQARQEFRAALERFRANAYLDDTSPVILMSKQSCVIPDGYCVKNTIYYKVYGNSIWEIRNISDFNKFIHLNRGDSYKQHISSANISARKVPKQLPSAISFYKLNENQPLVSLYTSFVNLFKYNRNTNFKSIELLPRDFLIMLFSQRYDISETFFTETVYKYCLKIDWNLMLLSSPHAIVPAYHDLCKFIFKREGIKEMSIDDTRIFFSMLRGTLVNNDSYVAPVKDSFGIYFYNYIPGYDLNAEIIYTYNNNGNIFSFTVENSTLLSTPPVGLFAQNNFMPTLSTHILQSITDDDSEMIDQIAIIIASALSPNFKIPEMFIFNKFSNNRKALLLHLISSVLYDNRVSNYSLSFLNSNKSLPLLLRNQIHDVHLNISVDEKIPKNPSILKELVSGKKELSASTDIMEYKLVSNTNYVYITDDLPLDNLALKKLPHHIITSPTNYDISDSEFSFLRQELPRNEIQWMRSIFAIHGLKAYSKAGQTSHSDIYCGLIEKFVSQYCVLEEEGMVKKNELKEAWHLFWLEYGNSYGDNTPTIFDQYFQAMYSVETSKDNNKKSKAIGIDKILIKKLKPSFTIKEINKRIGSVRPWVYIGISLRNQKIQDDFAVHQEQKLSVTEDYLALMNSISISNAEVEPPSIIHTKITNT